MLQFLIVIRNNELLRSIIGGALFGIARRMHLSVRSIIRAFARNSLELLNLEARGEVTA